MTTPAPYNPPYNPGGPTPYNPPYSPGAYGPPDPSAPYGRDPVTGAALSDKQKVIAGLLQIFLGQWGIGRFYLGDTKEGFIHLGLWVTAIFCILSGFVFILGSIIGFLLFVGNLGWALWDGVMIFTDNVPDQQGRKLR